MMIIIIMVIIITMIMTRIMIIAMIILLYDRPALLEVRPLAGEVLRGEPRERQVRAGACDCILRSKYVM